MSCDDNHATYPPLNTLKQVAENIWIVDGPVIPFGPAFLKMPFPTRMTIIRGPGKDLFIHSPTPLTDKLKAEIEEIGEPRWLIGPNRIHYWWIPMWHTAYPQAQVFLAPRICEQAGKMIDFEAQDLDAREGYPWDEWIKTYPVVGSYMTEVVFFHIKSRTLVLADLIENFERHKIRSRHLRWLATLGGVLHPNGRMPRDMRLTYLSRRSQLKTAVQTFLEWQPERVILAHGLWYETDGTGQLRRAFRWLL